MTTARGDGQKRFRVLVCAGGSFGRVSAVVRVSPIEAAESESIRAARLVPQRRGWGQNVQLPLPLGGIERARPGDSRRGRALVCFNSGRYVATTK